ncbi:MAG TPA: ankyrin repeat domain-containing protein, partial [Aquirhabdus sp.]
LITNGADINNKNNEGDTPLHEASRFGWLEIAQCLVTNGATINPRNYQGEIPFHIAVRNGYLEIVQCLVMNGADINAKYLDDYTPLHLAACNGYLEIVQCLVMNGADINTENNAMFTPLQKLLYHEDISIWVKDLLTNNRKCTECRRWTLIGKLKNEVCFECQWQRIRLLWIAKKKNEGPFSYLPAEIVREIINNF